MFLVHYEGFTDEDDSWVSREEIAPRAVIDVCGGQGSGRDGTTCFKLMSESEACLSHV